MSNYKSVEIGWIVTDKILLETHVHESDFVADPQALFKRLKEDDNGYPIPIPGSEHGRKEHLDDPCWDEGPLYLETHPHDSGIVFVSWTDLEHGFNGFAEPPRFGDLIRAVVGDDYAVNWGVIETER